MGVLRASRLLERMLAAGVSKYEPDPLGALARLEAAEKPPRAARVRRKPVVDEVVDAGDVVAAPDPAGVS
jgi:hypothetical protein